MTREEAIKTLKENYCAMCAYGSQNMDSCDIRSCDNRDAIKALEQEPISETDIILTREEYGELVSSEYDNGYAKGYREALEQEPTTKIEESNFSQEQYLADIQSAYDCGKSVIDKIRAEIEQEYNRLSATRADETLELGECLGLKMSLKFIDKYKAENESQESEDKG